MVNSVLIVLKHLIYGGTERYTLNLANSLAEKGISVTLISGDGPLASYVSPKVDLYIFPISRNPRMKEIAEKRIFEIAKACAPQIIHTQCRTSMVNSQLARSLLDIPLITHEHHMYDLDDYPFIVGELRNGAEKIITIGPYTARELIKNGIKKENVITILNGVDVNSIIPVTAGERSVFRKILKIKKRDKVVVCLSRLEEGKGIDKLARGFIKVVKKIPQAKLFIIGDDQDNSVKPFLKEMVEKNRLKNNLFVFNGEYDIRKYHAIADVFCYPALGKGMAVMEAMAAGIPVVGKRTFRKPFVMQHGVSGLMNDETAFYKIDPEKISENLIYLLKRPKLSRQMGKAGRKRIKQKFGLERVLKSTIQSYEEVINLNRKSFRGRTLKVSNNSFLT